MSINDDKRELLKIKQGLIEESETIKEDKPAYPKPHGKAAVENFFYHYKWMTIGVIFALVVVALFTYEALSKEQMDVRVLMVSTTSETTSVFYNKKEEIERAFEKFCPDFNEDGYVHVEVYDIDMVNNEYSDASTILANQTKLYAELQGGVAQVMMGNMEMFYSLGGEDVDISEVFLDLTALYPGEVVDKYFIKVKGSAFAATANWEASCPEDMYIALRAPTEGIGANSKELVEHRERARTLLDNIINGVMPERVSAD